MCITEYNEEKTLKQTLEEGIEIGRAEGKAEGIFETLIGLVKDELLPISVAAQRSNMTIPEFEAKTGLKA